jgi:tetratricopeptide (TPR) repeat protein
MIKQFSIGLWLVFILTFSGMNFYFWFQTSKLAAEVQESLAAIRSADTISTAQLTEAEFDTAYQRIQESEQRALSYLGIFESIGLAITVLGIVGTALGAALGISVRGAQEEFSKAKVEFDNLNKKFQIDMQNASITQLLMSMAIQQYELGHLQGAKAIYERALELSPQNPVIPYRIAYILTQTEELEEAEEILKNALKIDDKFAHAQAALGFVYRRKGDKSKNDEQKSYYKQAERYLLSALFINPNLVDDDGESWNGALAGLYRRLGREKDAIYHYGQAARITPQSSYPKLNLLLLQWKHKDTEKLIIQLEEVENLLSSKIKKDQDTYWDRADLMNIELALGNDGKHIEESLQTFLQILPRDAKDVLPRVISTTEFILTAASFDGDKRDKRKIIEVIDRLKAEQEKRNKDVP